VSLQQTLEELRPRSGAVPGHAEELSPERPEHLHRARVRGLLDRDEVARVDQRAGDQIEALLRAVDDQDLLGSRLEAEPQKVGRQIPA